MKMIRGLKTIALVLGIVCPATSAQAIGTVTDGGITFGYTNDFTTTSGNTVNTDFTGAAAGDQLYESWWFFRVTGDTSETAFAAPDAEDYTLNGGTTGRLDWLDPTSSGDFSASLFFEAIETGANEGVVFQNLEITNTSLSALTIDIFHYTDLDLGGSFGNDSATQVVNPDDIEIMVTDPGSYAPFIGYDADEFQVTTWRSLLLSLTDGSQTDLDGSGLPFGGGAGADFTGAFQWTRTLGVGETESFLTQFGSDVTLADPSVSVIPEPGTGILAGLGLMGLAFAGRRPSSRH